MVFDNMADMFASLRIENQEMVSGQPGREQHEEHRARQRAVRRAQSSGSSSSSTNGTKLQDTTLPPPLFLDTPPYPSSPWPCCQVTYVRAKVFTSCVLYLAGCLSTLQLPKVSSSTHWTPLLMSCSLHR